MLFKIFIPVISLASLIFAAPIDPAPEAPNGGDRVVEFFADISKSLHSITDAANAFNGDVLDASEILSKYEGLLEIMDKAAIDLKAFRRIQAKDAVQILEPSARIIEDVENVVKAIVSKKALFEKNDFGPVVADTFQKGIASAHQTFDVITVKLPENMLRVGESILKRVLGYLNKGKKTFGG